MAALSASAHGRKASIVDVRMAPHSGESAKVLGNDGMTQGGGSAETPFAESGVSHVR